MLPIKLARQYFHACKVLRPKLSFLNFDLCLKDECDMATLYLLTSKLISDSFFWIRSATLSFRPTFNYSNFDLRSSVIIVFVRILWRHQIVVWPPFYASVSWFEPKISESSMDNKIRTLISVRIFRVSGVRSRQQQQRAITGAHYNVRS